MERSFEQKMSLLQENKESDQEGSLSFCDNRDLNPVDCNQDGTTQSTSSVEEYTDHRELQQTSPIKRRKIDKDGFVTPATPDIPKTSCYYGLSRNRETDAENEDDLRVSASQSDDDESLLPEDTSPDKYKMMDTKYDEKILENTSLEDIIKNIGQETKLLHLKWSGILGESSSYELFCPTRLDKLIEQAKELESNLKQQKDILHRRLRVISETLGML